MPPKRLGKPKKVSEMGPKELEIYNTKMARHREMVTQAAMNRMEIREFVDPIATKEEEKRKRRGNLQVSKSNQRYEVIEKTKGQGSTFKQTKSSASLGSL